MIPTQTLTRAEQLATAVERRILDGGLQPGSFIGTRESLRQESGLAKGTVNEAVRLLAERGLVTVRQGRGGGLFVAEKSPVVRLRHTLLSVGDGASTVADVLEVRDALEPLVATTAARHRAEASVPELRYHVEQLRQAARKGDDREFLRVNWSLHEAIADIGPNTYLRAVYLGALRPISDTSSNARLEALEDKVGYLSERAEVHSELVEAILSGDHARVLAAVAAHGQPSAGETRTEAPADDGSSTVRPEGAPVRSSQDP